MQINRFITRLRNAVVYPLFFGTKDSYNTKRVKLSDVEVILLPFNFYSTRISNCNYNTELEFWVGIKRVDQTTDIKIRDTSTGDDTDFIQHSIDITSNLLNSLYNVDFMTITQKQETIQLEYFEIDSNRGTVNQQSFVRFTIPVIIVETPDSIYE